MLGVVRGPTPTAMVKTPISVPSSAKAWAARPSRRLCALEHGDSFRGALRDTASGKRFPGFAAAARRPRRIFHSRTGSVMRRPWPAPARPASRPRAPRDGSVDQTSPLNAARGSGRPRVVAPLLAPQVAAVLGGLLAEIRSAPLQPLGALAAWPGAAGVARPAVAGAAAAAVLAHALAAGPTHGAGLSRAALPRALFLSAQGTAADQRLVAFNRPRLCPYPADVRAVVGVVRTTHAGPLSCLLACRLGSVVLARH